MDHPDADLLWVNTNLPSASTDHQQSKAARIARKAAQVFLETTPTELVTILELMVEVTSPLMMTTKVGLKYSERTNVQLPEDIFQVVVKTRVSMVAIRILRILHPSTLMEEAVTEAISIEDVVEEDTVALATDAILGVATGSSWAWVFVREDGYH